jgi:uncharacterized metal-binding protein YceD (DUF177 family)
MSAPETLFITPARLAQLPQKTAVFDLSELSPSLFNDADMTVKQLSGQLKTELQTRLLRIWADVSAEVELICDRTLNPFVTVLDFHFEEALEVIPEDYQFQELQEFSADDAAEQVYPEQEIDLSDLVRQYLILNLPLQKISPETCYNEMSVPVNHNSPSSVPDPIWNSIRQAVESWEDSKQ